MSLSAITRSGRRLIRRVVHRIFWRSLFNGVETEHGRIQTTEGRVALDELRQHLIRQRTPCGMAYAREYYRNGRLVRRDLTHVVERGMPPVQLRTKGESNE